MAHRSGTVQLGGLTETGSGVGLESEQWTGSGPMNSAGFFISRFDQITIGFTEALNIAIKF